MIARAALVFPVILLASAACGGGSGTVSRSESGDQVPTVSANQTPGASANQGASSSADQPPGSSANQPASGGGDAGARGAACIQCDVTYICNGTSNGQPISGQSFSLSSDNGQCTSNDVAITCDGRVVDPKTGAQIGSFAPLGNGSFAVNLPGVQLTCSPEAAQAPLAPQAPDAG